MSSDTRCFGGSLAPSKACVPDQATLGAVMFEPQTLAAVGVCDIPEFSVMGGRQMFQHVLVLASLHMKVMA